MLETDIIVKSQSKNSDVTSDLEQKTDESLLTPDFKPFSFSSNAPVLTQEEETAFEVEKQYNFDTTTYDYSSTQEQMDMPTVEKNEETYQEIVASAPAYSRIKLNARGKIIVSVYSIIVAIIVAFSIYNAVAINAMQAEIVAKSQIVATETGVISDLQETYNSLGEKDNILSQVEGEFKVPTDNDIVYVEDFTMSKRPVVSEETNWFEKFCRALRNLFN